MFADVHDHNRSQVGQSDRAPDGSSVAWYNSTAALIPEFDLIVLPLPLIVIFLLVMMTSQKVKFRRKRRQDDTIHQGGDGP